MDNTFYYRIGFGNGVLFAALLFIVLSMLFPPIVRVRYRVVDPQTITPEREPPTDTTAETVTETDGD